MTKKMPQQWNGGGGSPIYFLGIIGAIFYYFQNANDFGMYVMGFLKALVWPAVIVYRLLESFAS